MLSCRMESYGKPVEDYLLTSIRKPPSVPTTTHTAHQHWPCFAVSRITRQNMSIITASESGSYQRLVRSSSDTEIQISYSARIMLDITYGFQITSTDNVIVKLVDTVVNTISLAVSPMMLVVNPLPFRAYKLLRPIVLVEIYPAFV